MFNQAKKVLFSYEFIPLLPDDSEVYIEYQNFINTFGQDGNVMCVGFKSDSLFTLSNYNSLIDLCDNLDKIYGVDKVLSVIQFENLIKNEKKLKFDLLPVNKEKVYSITKLDSIQNIVSSLPFYKKLFFNKDGNSYFIALTLDKDLLDTESRVKFIKEIEKNVSIFANKINVTPHYSGLPYIRTITTLKTKKEVQFFIILAFFTTAVIMFLFFRSFSSVFFSMIVVGIGVIWAIGTIHLLGFKITFLTALIPPLIIVIGIPNCVFLLNKYHLECKLHGNKIKAISRTIQKVGNATFMTNATTAAGFSTFIITRTDLLVQFGIVASINILVVFFYFFNHYTICLYNFTNS
jgi:predicted RND superfamily exporter protein